MDEKNRKFKVGTIVQEGPGGTQFKVLANGSLEVVDGVGYWQGKNGLDINQQWDDEALDNPNWKVIFTPKFSPGDVIVVTGVISGIGTRGEIGQLHTVVSCGQDYVEIDVGRSKLSQSWMVNRFKLAPTQTITLNPKPLPVGIAVKPKSKNKNKPLKKGERKPLFLAASRNGMTHKGLANMVNRRKVDTLGNSVTHALSKYEDRFGKKLDLGEAVIFRLVPYSVRIDKKNGRARIGSEIK